MTGEVPMSDGDALLSAILAEPDADMPRLMYADWLDEFGTDTDRARAEFIRVQVELAGPPQDEVRLKELQSRDKVLLNLHRESWLVQLRGIGQPLRGRDANGEFRRGFVEIVWLPASWFVTRAEVLFACIPVRELRLTRTSIEELSDVVSSGYFSRLKALDLSARPLGDDVARVLTRCPAVAGIRTLRLRGCGLTDVGAYRLADAEFDWPLAELDVKYNDLSARGLTALRDRFGAGAVVSLPGQE